MSVTLRRNIGLYETLAGHSLTIVGDRDAL
jgi:hypothetical protein